MVKINGKTAAQIYAEVAAGKKCTKFLEDRYPYHTYEEYVERMDAVFGRENYRVSYSECETLVLPNGQAALQRKCRIDFYGEGGELLPSFSVEGYGAKEIVMSKDREKYLFLNNCPTFARQNAFKDACRSLGIFGEACDDNSGQAAEPGKRRQDSNEKPQQPKKDQKEAFVAQGGMEIVKTSQDGKPVYAFTAYKKVGDAILNAPFKIIMYPNQYGKCTGKVNSLASLLADGKPHPVNMVTSAAKDTPDTLVFKGFWA